MLKCSLTSKRGDEWDKEKGEHGKEDLRSPKSSWRTASSAAFCTSWAMAAVSFLAFARVNVRDAGAAGAGEETADILTGVDAPDPPDEALVAGLGAAFADAAGAGAGGGADGAGEGTGCGFGPPMLREMVGAGAGASVCSGRSTGWRGGGVGCCCGGGMRKAFPGTNSNAPALSLLIVVNEGGDGVQDTNIFDLLKQDPSPTPM